MATTLVEPHVKILRWKTDETDVLEFEKWTAKNIDEIMGEANGDGVKVTWLAPDAKTLLCVIQWYTWA